MARKAVFLDKDGTLIRDIPYNVDPRQMELLPGTLDGLLRLHQAGYLLVVVSNQSGVAQGYFEEDAIKGVERHLRLLLQPQRIPLAGFYYCPHHSQGRVARYAHACECRKPRPGLLRRAAHDLGIDLAASWMVGDILNDVEAGARAGCRSVLINNGGETCWEWSADRIPELTSPDLGLAAPLMLLLSAARPGGFRSNSDFCEGVLR